MRFQLIGFVAALAALVFLGASMAQMPGLLQNVVDGEPAEEGAAEGEGGAGGTPAPEEAATQVEEGAAGAAEEETLSPAEEEARASSLREEAREAQRRAADLQEQARAAQERAIRLQEQAAAGEEGEELEELPEEEFGPTDPAVLARRIEELEAALTEMETRQGVSDEEIAALEDELLALEDRGQFLEENRQARIGRLEQGIDSIQTAASILATGNGDVAGALDQISQEFGSASTDASSYAGEEEARLSAAAQRSVEYARQALGSQDLFTARTALGIALSQARAARAAAETPGENPLAP